MKNIGCLHGVAMSSLGKLLKNTGNAKFEECNLAGISAPIKKKLAPPPPKFPADTFPAPLPLPSPLGDPPPSWDFQ